MSTYCPENFYHTFGEQRIASALTIVGSAFLRDPYALRHPLTFGNGDLFHRTRERNSVLSYEDAKLLAQGPIPIEIRGVEHMSSMLALHLPGIPARHEALCLVSQAEKHSNPSRAIHVVVEDHTRMVVQHMRGGAVWDQFDRAMVSIMSEGGSILLLPEHLSGISQQTAREYGRQAGAMIGMNEVCVLGGDRKKFPTDRSVLQEILAHENPEQFSDVIIEKCEQITLPWSENPFTHLQIRDKKKLEDMHHVWIYGSVQHMDHVPFRPHSACSSSEIFGANNCDCPEQLDAALQNIVEKGCGMIMYLDQEARGHGAVAKVGTWGLNIGHGVDLIQAFHAAGYEEDVRTFRMVGQVIRMLDIRSVVLLSNNVAVKQNGLLAEGINIAGRKSVSPAPRSTYCQVDHRAKIEKRGDDMSENNIATSRCLLRRH